MTGLPPSVHLMVDNAVVRSQPLSRDRLARAKSAYTTRRVDFAKATRLIASGVRPRAGDLVLARVERIGQHGRIELANGRRAQMHVGDEIIVCYGARYAPDQFEAYVPDDLDTCPDCGTAMMKDCPACHAPMRSIMQVDCRVCGEPIREGELFGVPIRRKAEPRDKGPVQLPGADD